MSTLQFLQGQEGVVRYEVLVERPLRPFGEIRDIGYGKKGEETQERNLLVNQRHSQA